MVKKGYKRITISLPEKLIECLEDDHVFYTDEFSKSQIIEQAIKYWLSTRILIGKERKYYLVDN